MTRPKRPKARKLRALTLEQLEDWLDSLDPPAAGVSMIDGFLTALIVSPRFLHPDDWIWQIIGDRARRSRRHGRGRGEPDHHQPTRRTTEELRAHLHAYR